MLTRLHDRKVRIQQAAVKRQELEAQAERDLISRACKAASIGVARGAVKIGQLDPDQQVAALVSYINKKQALADDLIDEYGQQKSAEALALIRLEISKALEAIARLRIQAARPE